LSLADGDGHTAVFEGTRWVETFVFQKDSAVPPHGCAQPRRLDQGGRTFKQSDNGCGFGNREQRPVTLNHTTTARRNHVHDNTQNRTGGPFTQVNRLIVSTASNSWPYGALCSMRTSGTAISWLSGCTTDEMPIWFEPRTFAICAKTPGRSS